MANIHRVIKISKIWIFKKLIIIIIIGSIYNRDKIHRLKRIREIFKKKSWS